MKRGRFVTFEGPEGSGKSTHIRKLAWRLRRRGVRVLVTREPGGTPTGECIRELLQHGPRGQALSPETELLLFVASRAQLVRQVIRPALRRGIWVLCDRFADSTTAYQGYGRGLDLAMVHTLNAMAVDGCEPDLTLLLDVPVGAGFQRLGQRLARTHAARDRLERESRAFHRRVRAGYLELARQQPHRIRVISAERPLPTVAQDIWRQVRDVFGL